MSIRASTGASASAAAPPTDQPIPSTLPADDARRVLLMQAYEDPIAAPWSEADATRASEAAAREVGESSPPALYLARRAAWVRERLVPLAPRSARAERALGSRLLHSPWPAALIVIAALAGLATNALGAGREINLLAPPLLALLAWNLGVYVALAVGFLRRGGVQGGTTPARPDTAGPQSATPGIRGAGAGLPESAAPGPWRRGSPEAGGPVAHRQPTAAAPGPLRRALWRLLGVGRRPAGDDAPLRRFVADWSAAAQPLWLARTAAALHAAAAAFALGALGSLYLRGLAFEYRAVWESTFLSADTVHALLSAVLGPASALTGIGVPDAAGLAALQAGRGPGDPAARWIHLWAVTLALAVVLPRLLLAWQATRRERHLRLALPLPLATAYVERLLRGRSGEATAVDLRPYSCRLPTGSEAALSGVLEPLLGPRLQLRLAAPAALGDEDDVAGLPRSTGINVALYASTATPERETHGAYAAALARRPGERLIVVIDESGFIERFGTGTRLESRRAAWRKLMAELGIEPMFAALGRPPASSAALASDSGARSAPAPLSASRQAE